MAEEFVKKDNNYQKLDEDGKMVAEIAYIPSGEDQVTAIHTFVSPSLRGQGVAERMLDYFVAEMKKQNKKIIPRCAYVASMFERKPEKYAEVKADKNV